MAWTRTWLGVLAVCSSWLSAGCSEEEAGSPSADAGAPVVDARSPAARDAAAQDDPSTDAAASQQAGSADAGPRLGGRAAGDVCGNDLLPECAKGLFCNYALAQPGAVGCEDAAGSTGLCSVVTPSCTEQYAPVCGCDAVSYGSACEANGRGITVAHVGLCTAEECTQRGARTVYSDGASTPKCGPGEASYAIPAKEPALCCYQPGCPGSTSSGGLSPICIL